VHVICLYPCVRILQTHDDSFSQLRDHKQVGYVMLPRKSLVSVQPAQEMLPMNCNDLSLGYMTVSS